MVEISSRGYRTLYAVGMNDLVPWFVVQLSRQVLSSHPSDHFSFTFLVLSFVLVLVLVLFLFSMFDINYTKQISC